MARALAYVVVALCVVAGLGILLGCIVDHWPMWTLAITVGDLFVAYWIHDALFMTKPNQ